MCLILFFFFTSFCCLFLCKNYLFLHVFLLDFFVCNCLLFFCILSKNLLTCVWKESLLFKCIIVWMYIWMCWNFCVQLFQKWNVRKKKHSICLILFLAFYAWKHFFVYFILYVYVCIFCVNFSLHILFSCWFSGQ